MAKNIICIIGLWAMVYNWAKNKTVAIMTLGVKLYAAIRKRIRTVRVIRNRCGGILKNVGYSLLPHFYVFLLIVFLMPPILSAQPRPFTPLMDGVKDSLWGTVPNQGSASSRLPGNYARDVYVTNDLDYLYIGFQFSGDPWNDSKSAHYNTFIDTGTTAGTSADPWKATTNINWSNKPDFSVTGWVNWSSSFGGMTRYRSDGTNWDGGTGLTSGSDFGSNTANDWAEFRIPLSLIGRFDGDIIRLIHIFRPAEDKPGVSDSTPFDSAGTNDYGDSNSTLTESFTYEITFSTDAFLVYFSSAPTNPDITRSAYRVLGATWVAASYMPTSGAGATASGYYVVKACPINARIKERVVVWQTERGSIRACVWDGKRWGTVQTLTTETTVANQRKFDVAYEQVTGKCIVVYRSQANINQPYYAIWNGSSWSTGLTISGWPWSSGGLQWIRLASKPNSDEITLVAMHDDSNKRLIGAVWNGSTWGNQINLTNSADGGGCIVSGAQGFDVIYEQLSGRAMVVWASTASTTSLFYSTFTTAGGWATKAGAFTPTGYTTATGRWIKLAAKKGSNEILVACIEAVAADSADLNAAVWNGSSWSSTAAELDDDIQAETGTIATRSMDVCYNDAGTGFIVWGDHVSPMKYVTYSGGSWSSVQNGPAWPGGVRQPWVRLEPDNTSGSTKLFLVVDDTNKDLWTTMWTGSAWDTWMRLETEGHDSSAAAREWFSITSKPADPIVNQPPNPPSALAQYGPAWQSWPTGDWRSFQQIRTTFTLTDPNGGDQVRFNIQFSTYPDFSFNHINFTSDLIPQGATNYITSLLPDGTWYWRVRCGDGDGLWSSFSSMTVVSGRHFGIDTTPPPTPAEPTVTRSPTSLAGFNISWAAVTDALSGTQDYQIYRATYNFTAITDPNVAFVATISHPTVTHQDTSGIVANTTYFYRIRARDILLNTSALSTAGFNRSARISIDGNPDDWQSVSSPTVINSGITATMSTGTAVAPLYFWYDKNNEQRNEPPTPSNYDITEFKVTADEDYIYFYAKLRDITSTDEPYIAISLDTNLTDNSGMNWNADEAGMALGGNSGNDTYPATAGTSGFRQRAERQIIIHNIESGLTRIELHAGGALWYAPPTSPGDTACFINAANDTLEAKIARVDLGITGAATARISIGSYRNARNTSTGWPRWANDCDSTWYYNPDALDTVSIMRLSTGSAAGQWYNDQNNTENSWFEDISDSDIDFWLDVRLDSFGVRPNATPTTPTGPTPGNGVAISSSQPVLSWSASTDPDTGDAVTSYLLEFHNAPISGDNPTGLMYRVNLTTTTWQIPVALTAGTYHWRVRARDRSGALSSPSSWNFTAQFNTTPNAPSQLGQRRSDNQAAIAINSWINNLTPNLTFYLLDPDTGQQVRFQVQVTTHSDFSVISATDYTSGWIGLTPQVTSFTTTPLRDGCTYYWRVRCGDNSGESNNWSSYSSMTVTAGGHFKIDVSPPIPSAPTLARSHIMGIGVDVSWSVAVDTYSGVNFYTLYRATYNFTSVTGPNVTNRGNFTGLSMQDTSGLSANTTYFYCLTATDNAGNTSAKTSNTEIRTARISIDGSDADWATATEAPWVNESTTTLVSVGGRTPYYEWSWRDKAWEQRTDSAQDDRNFDLRNFRIAADEEYIYFYTKSDNLTDKDFYHFAVAIDTGGATGLGWLGDDSNSVSNGGAAMGLGGEYGGGAIKAAAIIAFRYISTGGLDFRIHLYKNGGIGWDNPGLTGAGNTACWLTTGNGGWMEAKVRRSDIDAVGNKTLKIAAAVFENQLGLIGDVDSTKYYAPDALDSMSIARISGAITYNDSQWGMNSWEEDISDQDIDFWSEIRLDSSGVRPNSPPNAPFLTSPGDGATVNTLTPTFSWSTAGDPDSGDSVTSYLIEIANTSDFSAGIHWRVNLAGTSWTLPAGLLDQGQFWWRVYSRDKCGAVSLPSTSRTFTVDTSPPTIRYNTPSVRGSTMPAPGTASGVGGNYYVTDPGNIIDIDFLNLSIGTKTITIDGNPADWTGTPHSTRHGSAVRDGEWIYTGDINDERELWDNPSATINVDLTEVRVTVDSSNLYLLIKSSDINDINRVHWAVCIDTDGDYTNGLDWIGDDTRGSLSGAIPLVNGYSRCDYQFLLRCANVNTPTIEKWTGSNWQAPSNYAISISAENNCTEARISFADLGNLTLPKTIRLVIAGFVNANGWANLVNTTWDDNVKNLDAIDGLGGDFDSFTNYWGREIGDNDHDIGRNYDVRLRGEKSNIQTIDYRINEGSWINLATNIPGDYTANWNPWANTPDSSTGCVVDIRAYDTGGNSITHLWSFHYWRGGPPAAVTNLTAHIYPELEGRIRLTWTAPGDDGTFNNLNGGRYRIRWSTKTESDWSGGTWNDYANKYNLEFDTNTVPGVTHSWLVTSLTNGVTYYFRLWTRDDSNNWSSISVPGATAYACYDSSAPARVTDLTATAGADFGSIRLTWTSPGDNGYTDNISGGQYLIKYSADPAHTWDDMPFSVNFSTTIAPGTRVGRTITGLGGGTTYYFLLRTADEVPNWSAVSNSTSAWAYVTEAEFIFVNFDTGLWPPTGWAINDVALSTVSTQRYSVPNSVAFNAAGRYLFTPLLGGATNLTRITFWLRTTGTDSTFEVQVGTSQVTTGTWTTILSTSGPGDGTFRMNTIDLSPYHNVYLRFSRTSGSLTFWMDDVTVYGYLTNDRPGVVDFQIPNIDDSEDYGRTAYGGKKYNFQVVVADRDGPNHPPYGIDYVDLTLWDSYKVRLNYNGGVGSPTFSEITQTDKGVLDVSGSSCVLRTMQFLTINPAVCERRLEINFNITPSTEVPSQFVSPIIYVADKCSLSTSSVYTNNFYLHVDTTPPRAITDLSAEDVSCGGTPAVKLTWSAPGTNGDTGKLSAWAKFYIASTTVLAQAQDPAYWSTARRDAAEIKISTRDVYPGELQTYNITSGLKNQTNYYFRIWTQDNADNWSDISNGATVYVDATGEKIVSGYVRDENGQPLPGIMVIATGNRNRLAWTNASGYYEFSLPTCYAYIVMPSSGSMYFVNTDDPTKDRRIYPSLPTDQTNQNFTGYRSYGNLFYATEAVSYVAIDTVDKRISIRFVAERTQTYNRFHFYKPSWSGKTLNPIIYELRANDANGYPGALIAGCTTYDITTTSFGNTRWEDINLSPAWSLTAGTTYHIVIYSTATANYGLRMRYSVPLQCRNALDSTPNPAHNILYTSDGGASWTPLNYQPIYGLTFNKLFSAGNPYAIITTDPGDGRFKIYGSTWQGQQFWVETATITAKEINFFLRRVGMPADNCYWEIRGPNSFSTLLDSGTLCSPTGVGTSYGWVAAVTQGMLCPKPLYPNNTYWVMLKSPGSSSAAYYDLCTLYNDEPTNWDEEYTYRMGASLYARSIDGGATVSTDLTRDNVFRIKISTVVTEGPRPVTNLSALTANENEGAIKLNWTCPGVCGVYPLIADSLWRIQFTSVVANASNPSWWDKDATTNRWTINIPTGPVAVGEWQSHLVTSLAENVTYYFRLWSRYGSGDYWSPISNGATAYASPIPPGMVTDLWATPGIRGKTIDLNWTAPGDDGYTGTLIAGSRFAIQRSTWSDVVWSTGSVDTVIISTQNVNPGDRQYFTLTGLNPGTTYYIAIWTSDEMGSWSVRSATTSAWAQIVILSVYVLDISTYNFGALPTEISTVSVSGIIVRNDGNVNETYSLRISSGIYWPANTIWTPSNTIGNNQFVLYAIFKNTQPASGSFGESYGNDILALDNYRASATNFSDGTHQGANIEPFIISPLLSDTTIWFKLKTPLATSTTNQQVIPIILTAEESSP